MKRKTPEIIKEFLASEQVGGFVLIFCTILSILVTNSEAGPQYVEFWNLPIFEKSLTHWINDGLMTIFFLLIGLELKRELIAGQFSTIKNALLPVFGAIGGMLLPAGIHLLFNYGTNTQSGAGIPMATDAAFALAILSIVGKRVPFALKMLLVAIAVVDDLCAILVIAIFYNSGISWPDLGIAISIFFLLLLANQNGLTFGFIYIIAGVAMWYFMLHSGVHATISGVLLAITLPLKEIKGRSFAATIQHHLHRPTAFVVLPIFALANTCISFRENLIDSLSTTNSIGILIGLLVGKPVGVFAACALAVMLGVGRLSDDLNWKHVVGVGILAGIGFTISIFVSMLAFEDVMLINASKMSVLVASVIAAISGYIFLRNLPGKF